MKASPEKPTKDKILKATLEHLATQEFDTLTVRGIASKAGTNSALIGYYFGSKEQLVEEALGLLFDEIRGTFSALDDTSLQPKARLRNLIMQYARIIDERPDLFRRLFASNGRYAPNRFLQFMAQTGLPKMLEMLSEYTGVTDRDTLSAMILQTMGALLFPVLAPAIMTNTMRVSRELDLEAEIDLFIDNYFHRFDGNSKGTNHDQEQ